MIARGPSIILAFTELCGLGEEYKTRIGYSILSEIGRIDDTIISTGWIDKEPGYGNDPYENSDPKCYLEFDNMDDMLLFQLRWS